METRVVEKLEKALAYSEERIKEVESRVAAMETASNHMQLNMLLALIALLCMLHQHSQQGSRLFRELFFGSGTFEEHADEEEEDDDEADHIAQPEEENAGDASFDQLIDDNTE